MKNLLFFLLTATIIACSSTATQSNANPNVAQTAMATADKKAMVKNDTIKIANDSLEYEVIIIDPGFNTWLTSRAKPRSYYGLTMMETRNHWFISEYNRRVLDPYRYSPNLYEMRIDYNPNIRYGYEVNYLLYNYFLYFQQEYRQKL